MRLKSLFIQNFPIEFNLEYGPSFEFYEEVTFDLLEKYAFISPFTAASIDSFIIYRSQQDIFR